MWDFVSFRTAFHLWQGAHQFGFPHFEIKMGSSGILCFCGIRVSLGKLWQSLFAENLQNWAARSGWSKWSCFSGCWVEVPAFLTLPELIPQPWQPNPSSLLLVLKALPRGSRGIYNWSLRASTGCTAGAAWACWVKSGLGRGGRGFVGFLLGSPACESPFDWSLAGC